MSLLERIKPRLGVFYSTEEKDAEVSGMIGAAQSFLKGAGWNPSEYDDLYVEAIVLFCKMAQSTDPALLTNHPVLISFIAQGRSGEC